MQTCQPCNQGPISLNGTATNNLNCLCEYYRHYTEFGTSHTEKTSEYTQLDYKQCKKGSDIWNEDGNLKCLTEQTAQAITTSQDNQNLATFVQLVNIQNNQNALSGFLKGLPSDQRDRLQKLIQNQSKTNPDLLDAFTNALNQ